MQRMAILAAVLAFTAVFCEGRAPENPLTAKEIILKAIEARGGKERLQRLQSFRGSAKGVTDVGIGKLVDMTDEQTIKGGKERETVTVTANGFSHFITTVFDGVNFWRKIDGEMIGSGENDIKTVRRNAFESKCARLYPLLEDSKQITLALADEVTVSGRPAFGIKVRSEGQSDYRLYFDKETFLIVKAIADQKDENDKSVRVEHLLFDYKDFDGLKIPTNRIVMVDGKVVTKASVTKFDWKTPIDDKEFDKP